MSGLSDLRALLAEATPRPWRLTNDVALNPVTSAADSKLAVALANCADELIQIAEAARDVNAGLPGFDNLRRALAVLDRKLDAS